MLNQSKGPFAGKCIKIPIYRDRSGHLLESTEQNSKYWSVFFHFFFVKNSWLARNLEKRGYSLWKCRENYQRREIRIDFGFFVLLQGSKTLKIQFRVYKNSKTRASKFPNTLLVSKVNWRGTTRLYEELWIWHFCWLTVQWVGGLGKFVFWIVDCVFSPAFSQTITPFFEVSG